MEALPEALADGPAAGVEEETDGDGFEPACAAPPSAEHPAAASPADTTKASAIPVRGAPVQPWYTRRR